MITIWHKKELEELSKDQIDQWYDIYNNGLLEDRGYKKSEMTSEEIVKVQEKIKQDYLSYLNNLKQDDTFVCYILFSIKDRYVSQCRIIYKNNDYLIEGFETHKGYYKKGYGYKVLQAAVEYAMQKNIPALYSNIRSTNLASIKTHLKCGFKLESKQKHSNRYKLELSHNGFLLFDNWAESYNKDVDLCIEEDRYPFSGYRSIKQYIIDTCNKNSNLCILEMGIGTGEITKQLYSKHKITGVDFSSKMIEITKREMPNATFLNTDFYSSLSKLNRYDVILFSYSIHHISITNQLKLIEQLQTHLNENGIIIIGDVMTNTKEAMNDLEKRYKETWDDEEFYPVYETYKDALQNYSIAFQKVSHCSGIMTIKTK